MSLDVWSLLVVHILFNFNKQIENNNKANHFEAAIELAHKLANLPTTMHKCDTLGEIKHFICSHANNCHNNINYKHRI